MRASAEDPAALDKAAQSLIVGQTSSADVRSCLGAPTTTTAKATGEEQWTYSVTKVSSTLGVLGYLIPMQGQAEMRTVTLTFKKGVLSDVLKTAGSY